MIFVNCPFLPHIKCLNIGDDEIIDSQKLRDVIQILTGIPGEYLSVFRGCRKVLPSETIDNGATIFLGLSLPGGKGGFGSMLRAIGAQIEKTTNREACRDLTGRRLRDINEEQRLKKWLSKKGEREQEKIKRKKERLERLKQQPKHDFHDTEYNKQRSELPERIDDALTQGLQKGAPGKKRKVTSNECEDDCEKLIKKQCLLFGLDVSSSESESTDAENKSDSETDETSESLNDQASCGESSKMFPEDVAGSSSSNCSSVQSLERALSSFNPKKIIPENFGEKTLGEEEMELGDKFKLENDDDCGSNNVEGASKDMSIGHKNSATLDVSETQHETPLEITEDSENQIEIKVQRKLAIVTEDESDWDENVDLMSFVNVMELQSIGLDRLKAVLISHGLKCGGSSEERAQRLWSVRGLDPKDYPPSLKAKRKRKK